MIKINDLKLQPIKANKLNKYDVRSLYRSALAKMKTKLINIKF